MSTTTSVSAARSQQILLVIVSFVAITGLTMAFSYLPISWEGWRPATCMPSHCFCEHLRPGTIRQPSNTFSNLGFVLVGLVILSMIGFDRKRRSLGHQDIPNNLLNSVPTYTHIYGWVMILVGLWSVFYHASLTFVGQWFDVMAMYLLATFIILYAVARTFRWSGTQFALGYLLSNSLLGLLLAVAPVARRYMFGALLLVGLLTEIYDRFHRHTPIALRYLMASALSLCLAFTVWILDLRHILCSPHSLWQGHALWHILCAVAGGFLYLYYRSEQDSFSLH